MLCSGVPLLWLKEKPLLEAASEARCGLSTGRHSQGYHGSCHVIANNRVIDLGPENLLLTCCTSKAVKAFVECCGKPEIFASEDYL